MKEISQEKFKLYMANADNSKDLVYLKHELNIDSEILTYAADKNELSHLEYDRDEKTLLLIYNVLDISKQDYHYQTVPITFLFMEIILLPSIRIKAVILSNKWRIY